MRGRGRVRVRIRVRGRGRVRIRVRVRVRVRANPDPNPSPNQASACSRGWCRRKKSLRMPVNLSASRSSLAPRAPRASSRWKSSSHLVRGRG